MVRILVCEPQLHHHCDQIHEYKKHLCLIVLTRYKVYKVPNLAYVTFSQTTGNKRSVGKIQILQ
jgi:hypothetical protein